MSFRSISKPIGSLPPGIWKPAHRSELCRTSDESMHFTLRTMPSPLILPGRHSKPGNMTRRSVITTSSLKSWIPTVLLRHSAPSGESHCFISTDPRRVTRHSSIVSSAPPPMRKPTAFWGRLRRTVSFPRKRRSTISITPLPWTLPMSRHGTSSDGTTCSSRCMQRRANFFRLP